MRLPTTCSVRISPLDPHKSNWDHAEVSMEVLGESDDDFISKETAESVAEEMNVSVVTDYEPGRNFLQVEAPPESTPTALARNLHYLRGWIGGPFRGHRPLFDSRILLDIGIPGRFDLDIEVTSGSVEVVDVFEGDVKIQSGSADISVTKLKSMYIDLESESGDISGSVLQGNLTVRSENGRVDIGRVQGPSVRMVTDCGDIQTRALYAGYAMLRSREGTVRLGGAQGYTKVRTVEGNVEVAGVEGRLDVETDSGDVEASLSLPRVVSIRTRRGDVSLGLPESLNAGLLLEGGASLSVDAGMLSREEPREGSGTILRGELLRGPETEERGSVHARAPVGDVVVKKQSWGERVQSSPGGVRERFPRWMANEAE